MTSTIDPVDRLRQHFGGKYLAELWQEDPGLATLLEELVEAGLEPDEILGAAIDTVAEEILAIPIRPRELWLAAWELQRLRDCHEVNDGEALEDVR